MTRSGYSYDLDTTDHNVWRGAVASAIRGKRGQAFLGELVEALDALPEPRLVHGALQDERGDVCALGAVAVARGLKVTGIDPEDRDQVANAFGIAGAMAAEIAFENDEGCIGVETERQCWQRIREWAIANLKPEDRR